MSKKVILALVIFIVVVGGALFFTKTKFGSKTAVENSDVVSAEQNSKLYKDSDGDGLKDWEEELWGTDPNNPDTNGDGVSDFEDIRLGKDPVVKGKMLSTTTLAAKVNPTLESDLTETQKFSRELFAKYAAEFKGGVVGMTTSADDTSSEDQSVATSTADAYNALLIDATSKAGIADSKAYTTADFKIVPSTPENIRAYGNELANIITDAQKKYPQPEYKLFDDLTAGNNVNVDDFDKAAMRYTSMKAGMLKMNVPQGAVGIHVEIVNLFGIFETAIPYMKYTISDPVKAMSWLPYYPQALGFLTTALSDLGMYFKAQNIVFNSSEPGRMFVPVVQ